VAIRIGRMNTWVMYMRDSNASVPGYGAPQSSIARFPPTNGIESATE
jgi:hypothetical protein